MQHDVAYCFFLYFREICRNESTHCSQFFFRIGRFHFRFDCIEQLKSERDYDEIIYTSPDGPVFNQEMAIKLASFEHLVFINGRYEGIDSRVVEHYQQSGEFSEVLEISIGDYVLAGGEVASLVILEATSRLINGVLGNEDSVTDDSFAPGAMQNLLEGPSYTRPASWQGLNVPEVLMSGDHAKIAQWRKDEAIKRTRKFRPELQA